MTTTIAFLPPSPLQPAAPRHRLPYSTLAHPRAALSPSQPSERDAGHVPDRARRALLTSMAGLAFSAALPHSSSPAAAAELSTGALARDFLYDSTSGSFFPPSALPSILQHRRTGRLFDRCVVAAEVHDNACTHAAQLATMSALQRFGDDRPLIVGFEQFFREHDAVLDAFVAGNISLPDLLTRTEWPSTWGFDPMLYAPIFMFCREHGITMRGLNAPPDLVGRIAKVGIQGLSRTERALLPAGMDMSNSAHFSQFVDAISGAHHAHDNQTVARFYQVQVLWEEWMSESVARALASDSSARMLVLVGAGHVENRFGLPDRIERRSSERPYTILPVPVNWTVPNGAPLEMPDITEPARDAADLVWYTRFDEDINPNGRTI